MRALGPGAEAVFTRQDGEEAQRLEPAAGMAVREQRQVGTAVERKVRCEHETIMFGVKRRCGYPKGHLGRCDFLTWEWWP